LHSAVSPVKFHSLDVVSTPCGEGHQYSSSVFTNPYVVSFHFVHVSKYCSFMRKGSPQYSPCESPAYPICLSSTQTLCSISVLLDAVLTLIAQNGSFVSVQGNHIFINLISYECNQAYLPHPSHRYRVNKSRTFCPGTEFTNNSTIFLSFFYLFSKLLLNCF
jgi:hypothetical protein